MKSGSIFNFLSEILFFFTVIYILQEKTRIFWKFYSDAFALNEPTNLKKVYTNGHPRLRIAQCVCRLEQGLRTFKYERDLSLEKFLMRLYRRAPVRQAFFKNFPPGTGTCCAHKTFFASVFNYIRRFFLFVFHNN